MPPFETSHQTLTLSIGSIIPPLVFVEKKSSSCGTGKCGASMKETKSASCAPGKCGGAMKNDMSKMNNEMKDMKKDMKEDVKGSCGSGKCGSK